MCSMPATTAYTYKQITYPYQQIAEYTYAMLTTTNNTDTPTTTANTCIVSVNHFSYTQISYKQIAEHMYGMLATTHVCMLSHNTDTATMNTSATKHLHCLLLHL